MELKEPLDKLRTHLLRRGLPADYVSRTVQELADHHADLAEAESAENGDRANEAWRRLGDVEQLGTELARKYHARTFFGRHPLLTFVIAPLPAMIVFWVATFFLGWMAVFGVATLLGNAADGALTTDWSVGTDPLPMWSVLMAHYAILAVPPGIGAWWFCRRARRSGRGLGWAAMSCGLVVALAYVVWGKLEMPHDGLGGRMLLGIRCPLVQASDWQLLERLGMWQCLLKQFAHVEEQLLQIAAPLAVLAYAVWQVRRENRLLPPIAMDERVVA
jgi:hypothetical protein